MGVTGDFAALEQLTKRILRQSSVDERVAEKAAPKLGAVSAASFAARTDPYGKPWPHEHDLIDSGATQAGVATLSQSGTRIKMTLPNHARFQNPPLFVPRNKDTPDPWMEIVNDEAMNAVRDVMEGR